MSARVHDRRDDSAYFADFTRRVMAARIPLDGSIELTHRCNLRCVHCYLGDQWNAFVWERMDGSTSLEIIHQAVTESFEIGEKDAWADLAELVTDLARASLIEKVQ